MRGHVRPTRATWRTSRPRTSISERCDVPERFRPSALSSTLLRLVHDEQLRAGPCRGSVGCVSKVRHLIAHARLQLERATILQFGVEFAFEDVQDVPSVTPVIRKVAGCVLHYPNSHIPDVERSPVGSPGLA